MTPTGSDLGLGPNELAFYFESKSGIDAGELGVFLQRAATVVGRAGVELRVTSIEPGSVVVKMKALAQGASNKIKKELAKQPVATLAGGATLGVIAAQAISAAMGSPDPTPVQKAGSNVVINNNVQVINLVTPNEVMPLMDEKRARRVRERMNAEPSAEVISERSMVRRMSRDLDAGHLSGVFVHADGQPHFRPDGYQFLVPVKFVRDLDATSDLKGAHFQVRGYLETYEGQPDFIVIYELFRAGG